MAELKRIEVPAGYIMVPAKPPEVTLPTVAVAPAITPPAPATGSIILALIAGIAIGFIAAYYLIKLGYLTV